MPPDFTSDPSAPRRPAARAPTRFATRLAAADRCVLCGLCLPHCPTYAVLQLEGDSPRGRITLMQGLAQGRLDPGNARLRGHLEGCLGCRSCEAVCPARVPFGTLIDASREILQEGPLRGWRAIPGRVFAPLRRLALRKRRLRQFAALAARCTRALRISRLLPASSRLGRMLRHTEPSLRPMPALPVQNPPPGCDAVLFTGCMDAFFTGPDIAAALAVLGACDLRVTVPSGQVCCGALDQHLGRPTDANALGAQNTQAFGSGNAPIVVLDSGCEAQLREHPDPGVQARVTSLTGLLAGRPLARDRWRQDPVRVALHLPCTLRNVTGETKEIRQLFERLPGVTVAAVIPPDNCCGAAGTAMLTQPALSDRLGSATLTALMATGAEVIVSPNVGCSIHLRALAASVPAAPPVVSPASFLRDRLEDPPLAP